MHNCNNCSGSCQSCCGCGALELTAPEIRVLQLLGQIPFLPVARRADDPAPVFLEDGLYSPALYSNALECLQKRGLVSLDFDLPLKGFDPAAHKAYPIVGSIALTARGIEAVETMELQGLEE